MPVEWDGLRRVSSKRMDLVYLQPGADFRGYTKVIVDPTEVSFRKNWQKDYNRGSRDLGGKVSDRDIQDAIAKGVVAASDIFTEAWRSGGYAIADQPGPDVLRVKTAVANISVNAPDVRSSARSYSFSEEAGQATLVIEVQGLPDRSASRARNRPGNRGRQQRRVANHCQQSRGLPPGSGRLGQEWRARHDELKALSPIR